MRPRAPPNAADGMRFAIDHSATKTARSTPALGGIGNRMLAAVLLSQRAAPAATHPSTSPVLRSPEQLHRRQGVDVSLGVTRLPSPAAPERRHRREGRWEREMFPGCQHTSPAHPRAKSVSQRDERLADHHLDQAERRRRPWHLRDDKQWVSGVLEDRAPAQEAEPTARARDSPRHDGSAAAGSHSGARVQSLP